MALQITKPYVHVEDGNGNPYVGAKLYVYTPETTTLAAVYTDDDLTDPASNPATSDAAGNFPRLYIAAGTYKLRAETSAGVLIWEEDNIDTGLSAGTGALPINRGGTGATTAAAARTNLGVPSSSELTDLSITVATLQSSIQNIVSQPQGYLTPTSGTPVIANDVAAGTALYYTPMIGNLIPIYDGTQFNPKAFSELTLTLSSSHVADTHYDVFVFLDSGNVTIGTGPAFTVNTLGSASRGTGAGTTELVRKNGLWTNAVSITARNGSTTYTVDAFKGTFVGTILIDGTNGQITCHRSYGQSRKWAISNAYNRRPIKIRAGSATASWTYSTATWRPSNNETTNSIRVVSCLPETQYFTRFVQSVDAVATSSLNRTNAIGVGWNSTTATSGKRGTGRVTEGLGGSIRAAFDLVASYSAPPALGGQNITALEINTDAAGSLTMAGQETGMILSVEFEG